MTSDSEHFVWIPSYPDRQPFVGIALGTVAVCSVAILLSQPPEPSLGLHTGRSLMLLFSSSVASKAARAVDIPRQPDVRLVSTAAFDDAQQPDIVRPSVAEWAAPTRTGKTGQPRKAKPRPAGLKYVAVKPVRKVFVNKRFARQSAFLRSAKRSQQHVARGRKLWSREMVVPRRWPAGGRARSMDDQLAGTKVARIGFRL